MKLTLLLTSILLLAGCSSGPTISELSQDGPTMKELEKNQVPAKNDLDANYVGFQTFDSDINSQQISQYAERRVPNPELVIINLPRRDEATGTIIPKYSVRFPMYNRIHYSLFREVDRGIK